MHLHVATFACLLAVASTCFCSAALADKGCRNLQSRCAIEIGGRCDPVTGKWEYGRNGAGGNTQTFNDCIARGLQKQKK